MRWKLMTSHYLNVLENEWEYKEIDRTTGREKRVRIPVPRYFDVNDRLDWNNRWGNKDNEDGEIIVCHEGKGDPKDWVFMGDPTPDMLPLDDEAKELSASFERHWAYKPEGMSQGDYSQSLIDKFQVDMADLKSKPPEVPGLSALVEAMTAQTALIGKLLERRV